MSKGLGATAMEEAFRRIGVGRQRPAPALPQYPHHRSPQQIAERKAPIFAEMSDDALRAYVTETRVEAEFIAERLKAEREAGRERGNAAIDQALQGRARRIASVKVAEAELARRSADAALTAKADAAKARFDAAESERRIAEARKAEKEAARAEAAARLQAAQVEREAERVRLSAARQDVRAQRDKAFAIAAEGCLPRDVFSTVWEEAIRQFPEAFHDAANP